MRLPMGFSFGKCVRASDSLMTATRIDDSVSCRVNSRPAASGICIAAK